MELNNEFRVGVQPAVAWSVLTDVERVAPCLPGAQLQEVEGDEYRGIVKVKVGPITAQYKGKAIFLERDEAAGRVVLRAEGRDTRGQGNANATITATLTPDGDGTAVAVVTDLTVTGKVAQFGRGVMADVSAKLLTQFVECLERDVIAAGGGSAVTHGDDPEPAPAAAAAPADPAVAAPKAKAAGAKKAAPAKAPAAKAAGANKGAARPEVAAPHEPVTKDTEPAPTVRKIDHPEPAPVDLWDAAGGSVAKRSLPVVAGLGALLLVVMAWLRRRRRRARG